MVLGYPELCLVHSMQNKLMKDETSILFIIIAWSFLL